MFSSHTADCSVGCSTCTHLSSVQKVQCQWWASTAKIWSANTQKDPYHWALTGLRGSYCFNGLVSSNIFFQATKKGLSPGHPATVPFTEWPSRRPLYYLNKNDFLQRKIEATKFPSAFRCKFLLCFDVMFIVLVWSRSQSEHPVKIFPN